MTIATHGRYEPTGYQQESLTWAVHPRRQGPAVKLAETIRDLEDTYVLVIGEAGPDWQHCPFTRETLDSVNQSLRLAYQQLNTMWGDAYRGAYRNDNT